ncbi:MAG: LLM class flavin-dependent oxidoreductase [Acidimicrobiales bacterium]|nr:LLM class flavin-dependent oxidoreductase [Acidimicrobiales bacterium]
MTSSRLRFGIFLPPYHNPRHSQALSIERDLQLAEHLDTLGYDEIWFGEHHSGGYETIPSPELMIAAAAQRTSRIRLCTGVISAPYHHPLMVADRITFLDHMTRGRATFGIGPGALPGDSYMMGMDYTTLRPRMEQAVEAILRLLDSEEGVDMETDWFTLRDARLQIKSYTQPRTPLALAAAVSPSGPSLAGKHGLGLISFGSTSPQGVEGLKNTWGIIEEQAEKHGQSVSRENWSVVSMMHIAETEKQAIDEVRYGFDDFFHYHHVAIPAALWNDEENLSLEGKVARLYESGTGVVGTPEMAVRHVQRLLDLSGGIGAFLFFCNDWGDRHAMWRSYELFAREVAPHFDGSIDSRLRSFDWMKGRRDQSVASLQTGWQQAADRYAASRATGSDGQDG